MPSAMMRSPIWSSAARRGERGHGCRRGASGCRAGARAGGQRSCACRSPGVPRTRGSRPHARADPSPQAAEHRQHESRGPRRLGVEPGTVDNKIRSSTSTSRLTSIPSSRASACTAPRSERAWGTTRTSTVRSTWPLASPSVRRAVRSTVEALAVRGLLPYRGVRRRRREGLPVRATASLATGARKPCPPHGANHDPPILLVGRLLGVAGRARQEALPATPPWRKAQSVPWPSQAAPRD